MCKQRGNGDIFLPLFSPSLMEVLGVKKEREVTGMSLQSSPYSNKLKIININFEANQ